MKKFFKAVLCIFLVLIIILSIAFLSRMVYDYKIKDKNVVKETIKNVTKKEEKEEKKELSLIMVGDSLIHEAVYNNAKLNDGTYDFKKMIVDVKPIIEEYDLAFYNQESILGGKEIGLSHYPRFNSPYEVGDAFIDAGFNLVSLANNHTLDRGEEAIVNSLNYWNSKDVISSGSYLTAEEKENIKIREKNGITYALLAYTTVTNGLQRPKDKEYYLNVYDEEQVKVDIEKVRDKVDLLLVSMHFGQEYQLQQNSEQETIATYLSSLGVDIVIGHHPHVIQPVTYINDTLVIYSLGNFLSAQLTTDQLSGLMVGVDVTKEKGEIRLENLRGKLVYTKTRNKTTNRFEFNVIPYSNLTDDILPDKDKWFEKYSGIVKTYGINIDIQ